MARKLATTGLKGKVLQFRPRGIASNPLDQPIEAGAIEDTISTLRTEFNDADIVAIKLELGQEDEFED